ncbi:MAG: type II toxin-antitoxin system Phd/YefM family antitoxin [Burkholderiales bacterium]
MTNFFLFADLMKTFTIHEAKARLSELVEKAMLGEEIIIAKGNKPVAKLTALQRQKKPRVLGSAKGKILYIAPDFDAIPEEFKDYMP